MTPDDFRRLYDYHYALNHLLWERGVVLLSAEQFRRRLPYSLGSVRNQVVHLMNMEARWFAALRGAVVPGILNPVHFGTAPVVRARWEGIERDVRAYLADLEVNDLRCPITEHMAVWEVLWHVLNHGTDHRAQTLVMLAQLGMATFPQDYALFAAGKLKKYE